MPVELDASRTSSGNADQKQSWSWLSTELQPQSRLDYDVGPYTDGESIAQTL